VTGAVGLEAFRKDLDICNRVGRIRGGLAFGGEAPLSGTLEGANADIAIEFSRLITAANETLQELTNIIR
jgi:hypothetical protein